MPDLPGLKFFRVGKWYCVPAIKEDIKEIPVYLELLKLSSI
jgi:hypothetical protein